MLKNKIKYLLFLIIGGIYAILYNVYFIGIIYLAAALLPFALLGIIFYTSRKIKINLDTAPLVVEKEEYLNLPIYIKNTSVFPISRMDLFITYYNEFSGEVKNENIQVVLDQTSSQTVSCQLTSHYCGNLLFQVNNIRLFDYLHLWKINKKIKQSVRVLVMPKIYEIRGKLIKENMTVPADNDIYSPIKPGDDPSEVFDIREYREGDKPNRIHWKLSYKKKELMVKEFSNPINEFIGVLVELNCGKKDGFRLPIVDGILDCLLSVSVHLLAENHTHKIMWYDEEETAIRQMEIKRQKDSLAAAEAILSAKFEEEKPLTFHRFDKLCENRKFTHLIFIASDLREEDILGWGEYQKGTWIYLFYVNDISIRPVNENLKNLLQDQKIPLYEIDIRKIKESIETLGDQ